MAEGVSQPFHLDTFGSFGQTDRVRLLHPALDIGKNKTIRANPLRCFDEGMRGLKTIQIHHYAAAQQKVEVCGM